MNPALPSHLRPMSELENTDEATHLRDRIVAELAKGLRNVRKLSDGFTGRTAQGRELQVVCARGLAVDWIVLRTPICEAYELDLAQVAERNARLAFATIVLADNTYWLRVALPCDSVELADPERLIALVINAAGSLVARREPALDISTVFDHYTI